MNKHAIDNFKLIVEIHVLASETFTTNYVEREVKKLLVKKHRSVSIVSIIVAIVAMFLY